jgi:hypothetical protein
MAQWFRLILPTNQHDPFDTKTKADCYAAAGKDPSYAVFRTRAPDNELYFSPPTHELALKLGASPCNRPFPTDLDVYCGQQVAIHLCFLSP